MTCFEGETVFALACKLEECLRQGPKPADRLARYDWQAHNRAWLEFHAEVADFARAAQTASRSFPVVSPGSAGHVDVCISYHNLGLYLPQALEALEHQTASNFKVYGVNDASTDSLSNDVFNDLAVRYRQQSWQFTTNAENQGLSRTRNIAAAQGQGEYLIFVDADNVPVPEMVERLLTCIQASSDDCLTCYYKAFEGDDPPYRVEIHSGALRLINLRRILYKVLPLGNCAELGLFDNVFGDANFIVRRKVFEALGGFAVRRPQYQHITGEDHEFLARLSLAGYRLDVVPEVLVYYRHRPNSLFRTTSRYWNTMRVLETYQEKLNQVGLGRLLPLLYGLHMRSRELPGSASYTDAQWIAAHVPWNNLRDAVWFKLRKHFERVPFLNRFIR